MLLKLATVMGNYAAALQSLAYHRAMFRVFLAFYVVAAIFIPGARAIGVNFGDQANDLPPVEVVLQLVKSTSITKVKLYDANPAILTTFAGTGIDIIIAAGNDQIQPLATSATGPPSYALQWVQTNIVAYPNTSIVMVSVGNEVLSYSQELMPLLLPAFQNLQDALVSVGLDQKVKLSTPHSLGIVANSFPPSYGEFQPVIGEALAPLLQFFVETDSVFMVNIYPHFAYVSDPSGISLDYVLFSPEVTPVFDNGSGLYYTNMFDAQVDAVHAAISKLGFNLNILVTESGWPSAGEPSEIWATVANAQQYNGNLVKHVTTGRGTPARPNSTIDTFIFALFNENLKPGLLSERNFGLFYPDGSPVYNSGLTKSGAWANDSPPPAPYTPPPAEWPPPANYPPPVATYPPPVATYPPPTGYGYSPPPPPVSGYIPPPAAGVPPGSGYAPPPPPVIVPPVIGYTPPPPIAVPPPATNYYPPPPVSVYNPPPAGVPPVAGYPPPTTVYNPPPADVPPVAGYPPPTSVYNPPPAGVPPVTGYSPPPPPTTIYYPPPTGVPSPITGWSPPPPPITTYYPPPSPVTVPPVAGWSPPPPSPVTVPPVAGWSPPPPSPVTVPPGVGWSPPPPAWSSPSYPPPSPLLTNPPPPSYFSSPPPPSATGWPAPPTTTFPPPAPFINNTAPPGGPSWCVAMPSADPSQLQIALNWACGEGGADCAPIQAGAACYDPNTIVNHASYAFDSYFQINNRSTWDCWFSGTAVVTSVDPSYTNCTYP